MSAARTQQFVPRAVAVRERERASGGVGGADGGGSRMGNGSTVEERSNALARRRSEHTPDGGPKGEPPFSHRNGV
jgi:hypothetical protein